MSAEALRQVRAADPRNADAVFAAVVGALNAGIEGEALALARRGTELHPRDARMWQVLGLVQRKLDDLGPATDCFARAAALAPADSLIAHSHARTAMEAGLPAVGLFDRALRLAPNDASVLLGRAAAQLAAGDVEGAVRDLEAQVARHPGWIEGHGTVARLRFMLGDPDGLTASFERALAVAPREIPIWRAMFDTLMHAERYGEVLGRLASARAAARESPVFDALEAVALAEKGDTEAADRAFAGLGGIAHITMATRYMRHLLRSGRPEEASAFADTWQGRDPGGWLVPYQSAAWRLTGDARWQWLEGDERFIGVYDLDLPALPALAERLRGLHLSLHHPLEQSLRGGTQTDGPLFARIEPEIRALRVAVLQAVERHVAQLPAPEPGHPLLVTRRAPLRFAGSWSVRLTGEGFHVNHVHPAGWISSAFYVALPEGAIGGDAHDGWLSLGEATELGLDLPPIRLVEPKPGRLVLFPSTMWHGTRPFSAGERLTVAFDVALPSQDG